MSGVNYLDKLLDGVGVEWRPLGALGELVRGNGLQKKDFTETGVPAIHYGQIYTYYGLSTTETKSFVSPDLAKQLKKVDKGDVVITNTSENLEDVGKALVYLGERQAVTGGHATILKPGNLLLGKYFAYFTQIEEFSGEKRKYAKGTKVIDVSATDMAKIKIPIPCPDNPKKSLEIQAEIVRILDAFTSLTAELTAELTARKKQYNYYRDQLLSFEEGEVEWKTLDAICEIGDGNHSSKYPRSDEMVDQGVPFIRGTNMVNGTISGQDMKFITPEKHQELRKGHLKAHDVLMANRGEIGKIAQIPNDYAGSNLNSQLAWLRTDPDLVLPRYLFYALNSTHIQSSISGEGGALQQLTIKNIKLIRIPVPTLEEQTRIVAILDKFDALTNSITEGLPREIKLRQKQYEYYRDLLLGFPKDHPALTGTPPEEGNVFGVSVAENRSAPVFPSSGGVPEGRGGSL